MMVDQYLGRYQSDELRRPGLTSQSRRLFSQSVELLKIDKYPAQDIEVNRVIVKKY